jgi:apolipoprotein N-acyltransferase
MKSMILASAQTKPKRGNIESNLNDHYNLIDLASQNQADLIVFPEMSITGYERENALDLAFANLNDTDSGLLIIEDVNDRRSESKRMPQSPVAGIEISDLSSVYTLNLFFI